MKKFGSEEIKECATTNNESVNVENVPHHTDKKVI